jgi:hypothetical protein
LADRGLAKEHGNQEHGNHMRIPAPGAPRQAATSAVM